MAASKTKNAEVQESEELEVSENEATAGTPEVSAPRPKRAIQPLAPEVIDELPANPKRRGGGGGGRGKSVWINGFAKLVEDQPADKWIKWREYTNGGGARTAKNNIEKQVEEGKLTLPAGYEFELEVRRVDVPVDGENERHSNLYVRFTAAD